MTHQQAQEALKNGLLVKREKWPDSTWLSPTLGIIRLRTQNPFERKGIYDHWEPTQEDRDATDWVCRPS